MRRVKFSSERTWLFVIALILLFVVFPIVAIYLYSYMSSGNDGISPTALIFLIPLAGTFYVLRYISFAYYTDQSIILKKLFHQERVYPLHKIGVPRSYSFGRTRITSLKMEEDEGKPTHYLILNKSNNIFSKNPPTEEILLALRNKGRDAIIASSGE